MLSARKIEIVRRIQRAGYLREFDIARHYNVPKLKIENDLNESFAFEFYGGMGVILSLRITSDRPVNIQAFGNLEVQGKRCNVDWWTNDQSAIYKFDRGPEYPGDIVLNHRIGAVVKPGQPLDGILLGRLVTRIPPQYSHGLKLPLNFAIEDGFDNWHYAELLVQVDERLCPKTQRPRRGSLFTPRVVGKGEREDRRKDCVPEAQQYGKNSVLPRIKLY